MKATQYYALNGQAVAVRTGTGLAGVSTLVSDRHQTAVLSIANATKAVTQRRMVPYGVARGGATAWPGDRGFLNKVTDASGLVQVGPGTTTRGWAGSSRWTR